MKILFTGNFTTGWDGSICDEEHIADALEWMGHTVYRWQRDHDRPEGIPSDIKFTLLAQWDGYGDLSNLPGPLVYWAFDHQAEGQPWHERLVELSDLYLSKRLADSRHPHWQWLSQDFAPKFLGRHSEKPERDQEIIFTGSYLPWADERNATLQAIDEQYDLHVYGVTPSEWQALGLKNVHGPIMDYQLPELYARAKIVLSIDHTLEAGYWSDRTAQAQACGSFVMMRYVPLAETRFKHVAWFYSPEDALKKIEHYLAHDMERKYWGSLGYSYAQDNLMVRNRVRDLLIIMENFLEHRPV